jgi:hypothetical protein
MTEAFETRFVATSDRPALIACSNPAIIDAAKGACVELGYKAHAVTAHGPFLACFSQVRYQVVFIEELFAASKLEENQSLIILQKMPVNQRRHATIILFGADFATFDPMQAFQKSVHAVINNSEIALLKELTEKAVADNDLFLHNFREVQSHIARL